MRKVYLFDMGLLVVAGAVAAVLAKGSVHPEKLSKDDIDGEICNRPEMIEPQPAAGRVIPRSDCECPL